MPELSAPQRDALARNVKTPLVYTNVLTRNWEPWIRLGVHDISAPMSFHTRVKLDFPVSLGGYRHPGDPSEPMCLHLVHVPGAPNQGLDARTQFRIGQRKLLETTFADFEVRIRDELDRMLDQAGSRAGAIPQRSPSTAGRTATAMSPTRCSMATTTTTCWRRRGCAWAGLPSPIPTPAATPTLISRSSRLRARCASSRGDVTCHGCRRSGADSP